MLQGHAGNREVGSRRRAPDWYNHQKESCQGAKKFRKETYDKYDLTKVAEAPADLEKLLSNLNNDDLGAWKFAKRAFIGTRKEINRFKLTMQLDGWATMRHGCITYRGDVSVCSTVFFTRVRRCLLVYPVAFAMPKIIGDTWDNISVSYKEAQDVLAKEFPGRTAADFAILGLMSGEECWAVELNVSLGRAEHSMYKIMEPTKEAYEAADPRYHNAAFIWTQHMNSHGQQ